MNSKLLDRFFRGKCTPEETEQILSWFREQNLSPSKEEELFAIWKETEKEKQLYHSEYNSQEILGSIHQKIRKKYTVPVSHQRERSRISDSWAYALRVAAILIIPFFFSWLYVKFYQPSTVGQPPKMITVEAPAGVKVTKILPDSSRVILNAQSSITYIAGFQENAREITLVGEAFFEVAKDPLRPFIVHSGNLSTTALGTSFNINHRSGNATTEVSLATGRVEIVDDTAVLTKLKPGERLHYDRDRSTFRTDYYDTLETLAWKDGVLYFKEAGIEEVIQRLEDWYGVEITLDGKIEKAENQAWTYTGTYKNQNLANVLAGISYVKGFTYKIQQKKITLMFH
ncbi:MAG: FecR domain-containing protein [Bacteroidota bacterium]